MIAIACKMVWRSHLLCHTGLHKLVATTIVEKSYVM